jgi:hypothetical protein
MAQQAACGKHVRQAQSEACSIGSGLALSAEVSEQFNKPNYRICISSVLNEDASMGDTTIKLRARAEHLDLIDRAASLLGKKRSDFILEAACERAQNVELDERLFGGMSECLEPFEPMELPLVSIPGLS